MFSTENDQEYARLAADEAWVEENRGKFVAIALGSLVGVFDSQDELLRSTRETHPETTVFFIK